MQFGQLARVSFSALREAAETIRRQLKRLFGGANRGRGEPPGDDGRHVPNGASHLRIVPGLGYSWLNAPVGIFCLCVSIGLPIVLVVLAPDIAIGACCAFTWFPAVGFFGWYCLRGGHHYEFHRSENRGLSMVRRGGLFVRKEEVFDLTNYTAVSLAVSTAGIACYLIGPTVESIRIWPSASENFHAPLHYFGRRASTKFAERLARIVGLPVIQDYSSGSYRPGAVASLQEAAANSSELSFLMGFGFEPTQRDLTDLVASGKIPSRLSPRLSTGKAWESTREAEEFGKKFASLLELTISANCQTQCRALAHGGKEFLLVTIRPR